MKAVSRCDAIEMLALCDLRGRDVEWRSDELFCLSVSDLDENPDWLGLPQSLREEIETLRDYREIADPEHSRFDTPLLISEKSKYVGATNQFLKGKLAEAGVAIEQVEGSVEMLESCPCCGRKTLGERAGYEICRVCWWEDDGQDNSTASQVLGGPNGATSLTKARANFLLHGIFDPKRTDLIEKKDPPEKYLVGRVFELDNGASIVAEPGAGWRDALA